MLTVHKFPANLVAQCFVPGVPCCLVVHFTKNVFHWPWNFVSAYVTTVMNYLQFRTKAGMQQLVDYADELIFCLEPFIFVFVEYLSPQLGIQFLYPYLSMAVQCLASLFFVCGTKSLNSTENSFTFRLLVDCIPVQ